VPPDTPIVSYVNGDKNELTALIHCRSGIRWRM